MKLLNKTHSTKLITYFYLLPIVQIAYKNYLYEKENYTCIIHLNYCYEKFFSTGNTAV